MPHWTVDTQAIATATAAARRVVSAPDLVDNLARYYDEGTDYAGATFLDIQPNDQGRVTPADLLAITTLSVSAMPSAIRRILSAEGQERLSHLLDQIPIDLALGAENVSVHADAMAEFYLEVKHQLRRATSARSNPWVTASKLCARKRPRLFPVRDREVIRLLGLKANYATDWPVFAALISDDSITSPLQQAVAEAQRRGANVGDQDQLLRHLDVALWMGR